MQHDGDDYDGAGAGDATCSHYIALYNDDAVDVNVDASVKCCVGGENS